MMQEGYSELAEKDEEYSRRVSIEEKKALIREARKRYGNDWKKFFSNMKSGIDWQALKFKL